MPGYADYSWTSNWSNCAYCARQPSEPAGRFAGLTSVTADHLAGQTWIASTTSADEPLLGVWPGLPRTAPRTACCPRLADQAAPRRGRRRGHHRAVGVGDRDAGRRRARHDRRPARGVAPRQRRTSAGCDHAVNASRRRRSPAPRRGTRRRSARRPLKGEQQEPILATASPGDLRPRVRITPAGHCGRVESWLKPGKVRRSDDARHEQPFAERTSCVTLILQTRNSRRDEVRSDALHPLHDLRPAQAKQVSYLLVGLRTGVIMRIGAKVTPRHRDEHLTSLLRQSGLLCPR